MMDARPNAPAAPAAQRGMSLIEVLIAMVIAMIGVIIMMQVLITSDERTRTTGAGSDALSNGAVLVHLLQRDLMQAGYGINSTALLGCDLLLPTGLTIPFAPIVINPDTDIIPAGDDNTDTMLIVYGSDNGQPEGNVISTISGNAYSVQAPGSFAKDDKVVAATGGCGATALKLASVTETTASDVTVDNVEADGETLYNLGRTPRIVAFAVRNGALTSCDLMETGKDCTKTDGVNWPAVGGNIVSLRAQYGRDDSPKDGFVDTWDQEKDATALKDPCQWARTPAVRFVLVARSTQYESRVDPVTGQRAGEPVTTVAPKWSGSEDGAGNPAAAINLSEDADWQFFRYQTLESVAPTRNVLWMGQAGC